MTVSLQRSSHRQRHVCAAAKSLRESSAEVLYMSFLALTLADPFVVRLQRVPGNGTHFYVGRTGSS